MRNYIRVTEAFLESRRAEAIANGWEIAEIWGQKWLMINRSDFVVMGKVEGDYIRERDEFRLYTTVKICLVLEGGHLQTVVKVKSEPEKVKAEEKRKYLMKLKDIMNMLHRSCVERLVVELETDFDRYLKEERFVEPV